MRRTVVIVIAGAALTVSGCTAGKSQPTSNPPPPEEPIVPEVLTPGPPPIRTANPPPPQLPPPLLPSWDDVVSSHPQGATNPPLPVLAVTPDGSECFKEWYDPRTVPQAAREGGGAYLLSAGQSSEGTQVQCPQDKVDRLLPSTP